MKKLKIKWKKLSLLIVLLICAYVVGHDLLMVTVYSLIKGTSCGWTWYGFSTFLLAFFTGGEIFGYFIDEFNK